MSHLISIFPTLVNVSNNLKNILITLFDANVKHIFGRALPEVKNRVSK
jgi:hypothetical protein